MQDINAGVPIASVGGSAKLHPEPYGSPFVSLLVACCSLLIPFLVVAGCSCEFVFFA